MQKSIQVSTFYEAVIQLQALTHPISKLEVCFLSDFDAPQIFSAAPKNQELYDQLECFASELAYNQHLNELTSLKIKCKFTLNNWDCFEPLVDCLNQKNDNISIQLITSKVITEDSFITKIKNCKGIISQW